MELIPTPQEALIELYHAQPWELKDVMRYKKAIKEFEKNHMVKAPFSSYNSFKNYQTKIKKRRCRV